MNASEASVLSKLIPGFGGYVAEQRRRDDDLAVRRYLIDRLQETKRQLQVISVAFVDKAMFGAIKESEALRQGIETLQSKMRAAVEGYSSWFAADRIDESKLQEIVELDNSLIGFVDKLDSDLRAVAGDNPDFSAASAALARIAERFGRRNEILAK